MRVLCDTHVHCYDTGELPALLDSAYKNFTASHQISLGSKPDESSQDPNGNTKSPQDACFVLFFTNSLFDTSWGYINHCLESETSAGDWRFRRDGALIKAMRENKTLLLAPARQINSQERLEFLLLGCDVAIDDGSTAERIIVDFATKYRVICPWGVGKWLGGRGKLLAQLQADLGERFTLGDNGGRPQLWHSISHFDAKNRSHSSREQSQPILNGSDPLPIRGDFQRAASYGIFWQSAEPNPSLESLLGDINNPKIVKTNYGRAMGLIKFVRGRIALARR